MTNDPNNRPMNERQWADYIAQRKSRATQEPPEQHNAEPEQVYDLEVDSSLRGLAQISNDTDFVNDVMEKVAESNSKLSTNGQVRKPLPTVAPFFESNSQRDVPVVPEKSLASAVTENTNQSFEPEADHTPASRRNGFLVIAGALAAAAVSAYFLIPSLSTDQQHTTASQDSPATKKFFVRVGEHNNETTSADLPPDQTEQSPNLTPDHLASEEVDSLPAPMVDIEKPSEENLAHVNEPSDSRAGTLSENKVQPSTAPLLASSDQPVDQDLPATRNLPETRDLPDQPAKDERIIQSDKKWNLVLSCNNEGGCALTINDSLVTDNGLLTQSPDLFRGIGSEAAKRLAFLQPQIGKQIGGSITFGNERYDFEDPTEIEQTIEEAIVQLDVDPLKTQLAMARSVADKKRNEAAIAAHEANRPALEAYFRAVQARLEAARAGSPIPRELANLRPPTFVQKRNANPTFSPRQQERHTRIKESLFTDLRYSPSTDELLVCENAVIQTETFLRGLAKEKLLWKKQVNRGKVDKNEVASIARSHKALTSESQISDADFKNFVLLENELVPPSEEGDFDSRSLIQHLSGLELKAQLHANTRTYDLFADASAFRSAISFVNTNMNGRKSLSQKKQNEPFEPLQDILEDRPDLKGLPLVMGEECRLNKQDAKIQSDVSRRLGRLLATFDSFGNRNLGNDTTSRRQIVAHTVESCCRRAGKQNLSQLLVTLDQMMQIDHTPLVLDVIENLRVANTDTAIELLAKRAKFDLRPEVRFSATQALKELPREKYRNVLLKGFEYPWFAVAQHSAEALVRLDDTQAVPDLVELLKRHKSLTSIEEDGKFFQKEVVAVNHLRNCLLCHAPSMSNFDSSRGLVPDWERPLSRSYYQSSSGTFVRADVTYLTQDFSVVQPVKAPGLWPASQRFDYMVYKRPMSKKEAQRKVEKDLNEVHREAIVFALQSLTGETPEDDSWETWSRIADDMR